MALPRSFIIRLIVSLLFINLFVYFLAGLSLYQIRQQYETQTALSTQNLARSLETSISGILEKINVAFGDVVNEAERELASGAIDNATLSTYVARQRAQLPELDSIRTVAANGIVRPDSGLPAGNSVDLADRDYFRFLASHPDAGMVISRPLVGRISGKRVLIVARRITAPDGSFAGVAYGGLALDYVSRLFASFDVGEHGSIGLRDEELASIARYPEPGGSGSVIGNKQVSTTLLNNVKAHPDSGTYSALATYDKITRTITYRKVSHYPLYILVGQATSDYLAPWRKEVAVALSLAALFSLLTGIASWLIYRDAAERRRAEEALNEQAEELSAIYDNAPFVMMIVDETGIVRKVNHSVSAFTTRSPSGVIGSHIGTAISCLHESKGCGQQPLCNDCTICRTLADTLERGENHQQVEAPRTCYRDGSEQELIFLLSTKRLTIRNRPAALVCLLDVTEQHQLREQAEQRQKLDSIGLLVGGIAHDFNNMLTPILGYAQMIQDKLEAGSKLSEYAGSILDAANKSKSMVQKLMFFSRKQTLSVQCHDLNDIVISFMKMLESSIRENITITLELCPTPCTIMVDRIQAEQILLNLAVNAQDAISGAGSIRITTALISIDEEFCRHHPDTHPGTYIRLSFTDSGCGMDDSVLSRMFDPFFTTKPLGRGTGLGLSTVFGIIKKHNGGIDVRSTVGAGTTFTIYFPQAAALPDTATLLEPPAATPHAAARILVAEDNQMILEYVKNLLEGAGHAVLAAATPEAALELAREEQDFDLLVTDVVMPQMNGPELYERLRETRPELDVLFMSGYSDSVELTGKQGENAVNLIAKPFTSELFLQRIGAILSGHQSAA